MLSRILETNKYVVENAKHVKINYEKIDDIIDELKNYKSVHYLKEVPYDIYGMNTEDIVNFLLIYDSICFSFWGNPKWTINVDNKYLDGGIALLDRVFNLFKNKSSIEVYKYLECISLEEFREMFKGNTLIPLIEERYKIVTNIAKIVNSKMNGNFYNYIKNMKSDSEIFDVILKYFSSFEDSRMYKGVKIYFYKLAQLLVSDILHVIEEKERIDVDYSNLIGCADYKIPQVMHGLGILEYDEELLFKIENKIEIEENSEYEIEIRSSMLIVINYIWEKTNRRIDRIDINDFIWSKGQDKSKKYSSYHLTRTTSY